MIMPGQKHYTKQTVYDAHLTSKKHVKAAARQTSAGAQANADRAGQDEAALARDKPKTKEDRIRHSALQTFLTTKLLSTMLQTLTETKSNVERRFSLTAKEREAELTEKAKPAPAPTGKEENANEEEEEEERIYNPLKVPLGWDGKPIPYWLFKLHGLGVEYRCEICSDHVYMGRYVRFCQLPWLWNIHHIISLQEKFRASLPRVATRLWYACFRPAKHKTLPRDHANRRRLGLYVGILFHLRPALLTIFTVAEKLKREGKQEIFQQETMEELEDDEGNVYDRKTYMDLKKQGLI